MQISFDGAKMITRKFVEEGKIEKYTKLPMDNIVFGKMSEIPLLEMLMNLSIVTKEHVEGTIYDKTKFQMVMRIIDGKLLMRGQDLIERPDAYAWKTTKVLNAKNKRALGVHSTEGALTFVEVMNTIKDEYEKKLFADLIVKLGVDLMLIHSNAEKREVIIVDENIIKKTGYFNVPNSYDILWPSEGAKGVELTPVKVGDALVIEDTPEGKMFYVVGKDEFELTHVKG